MPLLYWHDDTQISRFFTTFREINVKNIVWIYYAGDVINANLFQVLIAVCTARYNALHFLLQPEAISQAVLILFVGQLEQISISQHRGGRSEEIKWQNNPLDLALQRYFTSCYRRIKKNGLVLQKQRRISRERKPWDFRMLQRVVLKKHYLIAH